MKEFAPIGAVFPLKAGPIKGRFRSPDKITGSHENCSPLKRSRKKDGGIPMHLQFKEKHCSSGCNLFPESVYSYLEGLRRCPQKQIGRHKSCSPL